MSDTKKKSVYAESEAEEEIDLKNEELKPEPRAGGPAGGQGVMFYLMTYHMWIFAIWLIPLSVFYDIFWWFRARFNYWFRRSNAHLRHDEKVRLIIASSWSITSITSQPFHLAILGERGSEAG